MRLLSNNKGGLGILRSVLIFTLSFYPARIFLRVGSGNLTRNKLTNSSLILSVLAIASVIIAFIASFIFCGPAEKYCDGFGFVIINFQGIFLAAILYTIALILLLVNRFKK